MALTARLGSAILLPLVAFACSAETPPALRSPGTATGGGGGTAAGGNGGLSSGGSAPTPQQCKAAIYPGRTPLRRLTAAEYNNTVRDLLGDTTSPGNDFPPPAGPNNTVMAFSGMSMLTLRSDSIPSEYCRLRFSMMILFIDWVGL